jgi:hypothetical protein
MHSASESSTQRSATATHRGPPEIDIDRAETERVDRVVGAPAIHPRAGTGKSFRFVLATAVALLGAGLAIAFLRPQYGGVLIGFGACGVVVAAIIAGMRSLGERRGSDQKLDSAP